MSWDIGVINLNVGLLADMLETSLTNEEYCCGNMSSLDKNWCCYLSLFPLWSRQYGHLKFYYLLSRTF